MDKLTLAHEYAKVLLNQPVTRTIGEVVNISFGLAEEMLAEEERRKDKSRPEVIEKVDKKTVDWVNEYPEFDPYLEYHSQAKVTYDSKVMYAYEATILWNAIK